jgi:hypothetical protein
MEIKPPECFSWVYHEFIKLYNASDTIITPATVRDYEKINQFRFKLYEIELIFHMKIWARDEIQKLDNEEVSE